MKKILAAVILSLALILNIASVSAQQATSKPKITQISYGPKGHTHTKWNYVKPYTKKDGTYVTGHYRKTK